MDISTSYRERYEEYLKSEKWAKKRQLKATQQRYICEKCGKRVLKGFHIHHLTYKNFGNEPLYELQFLCEDCHISEHCKIKAVINSKNPKVKNKKSCNNCFYSQTMRYKNSKCGRILYCNKKLCTCEGVCQYYRKGAYNGSKGQTKKNKNKYKKKNNLHKKRASI